MPEIINIDFGIFAIPAAIVIIILLLYYIFTYGISHILDFYTTSEGVGFYLFKCIKIFEIKYKYIKNCQAYGLFDFSWAERGHGLAAFFCLSIGGWPRWTKVVLTLKRGPFRYISFFPRDAKAFAEEVLQHLSSEESESVN